ncbi:4'-phosphopantetheinyl transferase family protein [Streptomyces sp. NRRL S-118]|uniref:4'-phosphopantetheinyl transferase family protein n=1 Tax=Streptomyces sp. NRRL S-118 TaxID=1463881 RepID=UPI00131C5355|nr:4'-phosphopantetheinyl transferase family protein [Streptomyces sp. NRRL S-118]
MRGTGTGAVTRPTTVQVAIRPTRDVLPLLDAVRLAPYEEARAARLAPGPRRDDFLAAHVLVRLCAARSTGEPLSSLVIGQRCEDCGGDDHGRPYLPGRPGTGVSLSHAEGVVAAAAGPGPVGVDVEAVPPGAPDARLLARVLAPPEIAAVRAAPDPMPAFLRHWVRKEALVKVGAATLGTLRRLDLTDPATTSGLRLHDWTSPDGRLLAAVATGEPSSPGPGGDPVFDPPPASGGGTTPLPLPHQEQYR